MRLSQVSPFEFEKTSAQFNELCYAFLKFKSAVQHGNKCNTASLHPTFEQFAYRLHNAHATLWQTAQTKRQLTIEGLLT